jgi:hypothetical protein
MPQSLLQAPVFLWSLDRGIQEHSQLFLGMLLLSPFPLLLSGEVSCCHRHFATTVPLLPPLLQEIQRIFLPGYHHYLNLKRGFSCYHRYHHYLESGSSCYHCYCHYLKVVLPLPLLPPLPQEWFLLLPLLLQVQELPQFGLVTTGTFATVLSVDVTCTTRDPSDPLPVTTFLTWGL